MNSENKDTISVNITISVEMEVAIAELIREIGYHLKKYQLTRRSTEIPVDL